MTQYRRVWTFTSMPNTYVISSKCHHRELPRKQKWSRTAWDNRHEDGRRAVAELQNGAAALLYWWKVTSDTDVFLPDKLSLPELRSTGCWWLLPLELSRRTSSVFTFLKMWMISTFLPRSAGMCRGDWSTDRIVFYMWCMTCLLKVHCSLLTYILAALSTKFFYIRETLRVMVERDGWREDSVVWDNW